MMQPKQRRFRLRSLDKDVVYEEAVVKHLFRCLDVPEDLGIELWKEDARKSLHDFGTLKLSAFCQRTRFPLWLGSKRFDAVRQLPLSKLLGQFEATHIYHAWHEVAQAAPDQRQPSGLIFPLNRTKFMALHTYPSELKPGATRVVIPRSRQTILVLEPLKQLLRAIRSWRCPVF